MFFKYPNCGNADRCTPFRTTFINQTAPLFFKWSSKNNMTKNNLTIFVLLLTAQLTMNFRCRKEVVEPTPLVYTFEVPIDIYPLKKSYSLKDTIWIETDLPTKFLYDTKTKQNIFADTGNITLSAVFNEFGTSITSPPNGFCDVITLNGVNNNRQLSQWGTSGSLENYGCGQSNYKCRVGFKPNQKGTYWLSLFSDLLFKSCANKVIPYNALISYKYKSVDLNLDVFNSLSINDKGGNNSAVKFYTDKINNREGFVFKVE